ncbi:hypothetical protein DPMN_049621 [Dreissena polymorpha]|uniref:Uncharacterized protein n=1 Tax=Dreissena polymorpha TaxID=45954 RepID=A0A9D4CFQ0_DREPO|nr:hypothetical protein DPMN_049616 [Dreissena polymorpha]KAH3723826.1 hypothetical protein DPMN_049621 [Dreissena polymorpha]
MDSPAQTASRYLALSVDARQTLYLQWTHLRRLHQDIHPDLWVHGERCIYMDSPVQTAPRYPSRSVGARRTLFLQWTHLRRLHQDIQPGLWLHGERCIYNGLTCADCSEIPIPVCGCTVNAVFTMDSPVQTAPRYPALSVGAR